MLFTPQQIDDILHGHAVPLTVDSTDCVVVRKDIFQKLQTSAYDDSDWSEEEIRALAARTLDAADDQPEIK